MLMPLGIFCLAMLSTPASAQDAAQTLTRIREQALHAEYEEATSALDRLLARDNLAASDRNDALEILATIRIAERSGAEQVLEDLYRRDPGHRVTDPNVSPVVLDAFNRMRANPPSVVAVELDHDPPVTSTRGGVALHVRVTRGADAVDGVQVSHRRAGEDAFERTHEPLGSDGSATVILLGRTMAEPLEYYIEALAPSETPLGRLGSPIEPLDGGTQRTIARQDGAIVVLPPNGGPATPTDDDADGILTQWWFWTAAGAVVVGAVLVIVLASSSGGGEADPPSTTLGELPFR